MKEAQTFESFNQDLADFHQTMFKKRNYIELKLEWENIEEFRETREEAKKLKEVLLSKS
ncbi:hypothetical protein HPNQ4228_0578 [Helicobacter pylori NQ4228]|uniref:hypothetical protein n=1 Tax=Helicobacter pylori TaxID=210 RepID=UPI00026A7120|nr:hypothetical protein [Helicobacter pylori]EJB31566.1 hypothetical protein HPNQ4228_0578 [Helicobacter pylori NQ4228]WRA92771.1 hypothetical protein E5L38_01945 [Helicobacter pylori]